MGSPYSFDRMYSNYSDMWDDKPTRDFVSLTDEQKRRKADEEFRKGLPWYMTLDKDAEDMIMGTEEAPTAAGFLKHHIVDPPLHALNQGKEYLQNKIAGTEGLTQDQMVEGVLRNPDPGDYPNKIIAGPHMNESFGLPVGEEVDAPTFSDIDKTILKKAAGAVTDPSQIAMMAGGPAGAIIGATMAPGMVQGGSESIGKGWSEIESGKTEHGLADVVGGAFDVGMGGLGVKHAVGEGGHFAASEVAPESVQKHLERPVEWTETPESLRRTWRDGQPTPFYVGDELGFSGKPSAERGAVGADISKLNAFEDSQFRKYGKEWRTRQSPEESAYHQNLLKGAPTVPEVSAPSEAKLVGSGKSEGASTELKSELADYQAELERLNNEDTTGMDIDEIDAIEKDANAVRARIKEINKQLSPQIEPSYAEDLPVEAPSTTKALPPAPEENVPTVEPLPEETSDALEVEPLPEEPGPSVEAPPKELTAEDLNKVMDPETSQRVADLMGEGYDLKRATRIAKAEARESELLESGREDELTMEDLETLMDLPPANDRTLADFQRDLKKGETKPPSGFKQPPPPVEGLPEKAPETPLTTFKVKLSNGETYGIKARGPEDAINRVNKRIEEYGVDVKAVEAKEQMTKLEQLIQSPSPSREREMLSASEKIEKAKNAEELQAAREEERQANKAAKEQAKTIKEQEKAERDREAEDVRRMDRALKLKRQMQKVQMRERDKLAKAAKPKDIEREEILDTDTLGETWRKMTPGERLRAPLDLLKSVKASLDLGHILRQGKQLTVDMMFNDRRALADSLKTMAKQTISEGEFKGAQEALGNDSVIKQAVEDFGLDLPGLGKGLKEEAFQGGVGHKLPGIKHVIKASDRAYTAYLNAARAWKFKDIVKKLEASGLDRSNPNHAKAFQDAAKAVNIIGSRGHFSHGLTNTLNNLNSVLWSPRHRAAKFQQIGSYLKSRTGLGEQMHNVVAKEMAKSFERTAGVNLSLLGLASASGAATVEWDPRHTDFAKFKFGDSVVDPWYGLQPIIRNVARAVTLKEISSTGREKKTNPAEQVMKYLASGASPAVNLFWEQAFGETITGYPKDRVQSIVEAVAPMIVTNTLELLHGSGALATATLTPAAVLGEGVDTRGERDWLGTEDDAKKNLFKKKSSSGSFSGQKKAYF